MNLKFWRKEKVTQPAETQGTNTLGIYGNGNSLLLSLTVKPWTVGVVEPWKDFHKWFFGKTSPSYTFRHATGNVTIRRVDIVKFEIKTGKEKVHKEAT